MENQRPIPKAVKVLAVLNDLGGKSGTSNLLYHFRKNFPNDYIHPKLLIRHLHFLYRCGDLTKTHKSYKGKSKSLNPQTYQINDKGKYYLNKWGML